VINETTKNETKTSDDFTFHTLHALDSRSTIFKSVSESVSKSVSESVSESLSEGDYITSDAALDYLAAQKSLFESTIKSQPVEKDKEIQKSKTITCYDLTFIFNESGFEITYPSDFTSVNVMDSVNGLLKEMGAISQKGFVNVTDLSTLPVFSDFIPLFTVDDRYITGSAVSESLKWINSLILISLYKILLVQCDDPTGLNNEVESSDTQVDLMELMSKIYKFLDPSLRRYIQKRGVTIIKNVYSGFDTEYKNKDEKLNNLISVQIATSTKIIIKLPLLSSYKLSIIDAQTNKIHFKKFTRFDEGETENENEIETGASKKSKKGFDFSKMENFLDRLG
jgi:hypothetical protein